MSFLIIRYKTQSLPFRLCMLSVLRWTLFVHGLEMNLPRIASVVRVHTWFALSSYPLLPGGRSQQCRPGLCAKFSPKVVNKAHVELHLYFLLFLHLWSFPSTASSMAQSSCFLIHLTVSRACIASVTFGSDQHSSPLVTSWGRTKHHALRHGTPACRGHAQIAWEKLVLKNGIICLHLWNILE